jgi:hypothetical protein
LRRSILPDLEQGKGLILALNSSDTARENTIDIIRDLTSAGYYVVVVSTDQPFEVMRRSYERNNIDPASLFFIDAITNYALGTTPAGVPGVKFISSPSNLTDLGIAITGVVGEAGPKKMCVIFDSVNTMFIYLPSVDVSKFLHYIGNRLRILGIPGIFLAVGTGLNPMILARIDTLVDEVIDFGPGADSKDLIT